MSETKQLPVVETILKYTNKMMYILPINELKKLDKNEIINRIQYCVDNNLIYRKELFEVYEHNMKNKKNIEEQIIPLIIKTLEKSNYKYKLDYYKKLNNIKDRINGKKFNYRDHLKALILAQLNNYRWDDSVENKKSELNKIFNDFDKEFILSKDRNYFIKELKRINCTKPLIENIIDSFYYNIKIFNSIEREYGSLDNFVFSKIPNKIVYILREGKYKLKQVGTYVAIEYLISVGVNVSNISRKSLNLFEKDKLNLNNRLTREEGLDIIKKLSIINKKSELEIECILEAFTKEKKSNICTDTPKCSMCYLNYVCNRGINYEFTRRNNF